MKIGFVRYLNAIPFYINGLNEEYTLHFDIPTSLNRLLLAKEVSLALTSSLMALEHSLSFLPHFGIACAGEILSVTLFVKEGVPLKDACIALTTESKTSIALLHVLCRHFWNVSPCFTQDFTECTAYLLIGDEALRKKDIPGFQSIDLGKEWFKFTGLPFVFALFSYQEGEFKTLEKNLDDSLTWVEQNRDAFLDRVKSDLPRPLLAHYYSLCRYRLGPKEMEGLTLFKQLYV